MHPLLLAAWLGCQALDLSSTAVALQHPRIVEGNRLMRGPQLATLKVSVNVGMFLAARKLAKTHPGGAVRLGVPAIMAAAGCVPGALNLRTMGKLGAR